MRVKETRIAFGVLTVLIVLSCCKKETVPTKTGTETVPTKTGTEIAPTKTSLELNKGKCAGCFRTAGDKMFSFVVRTDADYDSLKATCYHERIEEDRLPPRPGADEIMVYVSLTGSGCKGCLSIANVREASLNTVVEAEGGFQGNCEKLIVTGAWALIRGTEKPITFQFKETNCADNQ